MKLKILKKLCSAFTDDGYKAEKQHMENSGKDAVLLGVYSYLFGREKFLFNVLDFRACMSHAVLYYIVVLTFK